MAVFDFEIPKGFLEQLGRLADVEIYAPKMLEEAAPILVRTTKASLRSVTMGQSSGQMVDSVRTSRISHNKFGWYLVVRPTGVDKNYKIKSGEERTRRKPLRNMEKAAYLQYGTSKQAPRPWAEKAMNDAKAEVLDKMQEVFEREVSK